MVIRNFLVECTYLKDKKNCQYIYINEIVKVTKLLSLANDLIMRKTKYN